MNINISNVFDIIIGIVFVIVLIILAIGTIYFEIKDEKERKENIRKMQGEM